MLDTLDFAGLLDQLRPRSEQSERLFTLTAFYLDGSLQLPAFVKAVKEANELARTISNCCEKHTELLIPPPTVSIMQLDEEGQETLTAVLTMFNSLSNCT